LVLDRNFLKPQSRPTKTSKKGLKTKTGLKDYITGCINNKVFIILYCTDYLL